MSRRVTRLFCHPQVPTSTEEYEPIVEDRLPLLIQKQLESEIEQRPPLFPWETKIDDYDRNETESGHPKNISIPTIPPNPNSD
jgi:hypothetical protein